MNSLLSCSISETSICTYPIVIKCSVDVIEIENDRLFINSENLINFWMRAHTFICMAQSRRWNPVTLAFHDFNLRWKMCRGDVNLPALFHLVINSCASSCEKKTIPCSAFVYTIFLDSEQHFYGNWSVIVNARNCFVLL